MNREELSQFRKEIKENEIDLQGVMSRLEEMLQALLDEDPKIRKNVALLLGELPWDDSEKQQVFSALMNAYRNEVVLYVKASYLKGVSGLSITLPTAVKNELEKRFLYLLEEETAEDEKKHIKEELRWLMNLLGQEERAHRFKGIHKKVPLLLSVSKDYENYLLHELKRKGANQEDLRKTPFGIRVMTDELSPILSSRIYDKIYFIVPIRRGDKLFRSNMKEIIEGCMLEQMLSMYLEGEGPIPFRVSVSLNSSDKDENHKAVEEFSNALEDIYHGRLFNAPGNYEIELRFAQRSDESFGMYLWLKEFKNERFSYRTAKVDTSMAPTKAAVMLEMAYPYLKEGGFTLDPFCGAGTLLIERQMLKRPGESFGTDTFGTAISEARESAKRADASINFIQRDYFDFTFDGDFDEIITEFPDLFHREKAEKEEFLKKFFNASLSHTRPGAVWVVLTNENSSFKRQMKRTPGIRLLREIPFGGRRNLFIMERK